MLVPQHRKPSLLPGEPVLGGSRSVLTWFPQEETEQRGGFGARAVWERQWCVLSGLLPCGRVQLGESAVPKFICPSPGSSDVISEALPGS